ncbi:MAG: phosphate acyltransferase PlsX, partial [Vallitaleaceae bacterium]|nr:phosphate acyltransferase PlsX [Vallitaleaceae bacterium]
MTRVTIAVDAMGGDHAPDAILEGSINALTQNKQIHLILFGDREILESKLAQKEYDRSRLTIEDAKEVIENTESPVLAIRRKKDSSIVKGLRCVKEKRADAFVSCGSTGAVLAGSTLIIGRIKGIERPALGSFIPTQKGVTLLMDCGANVDSKPHYLHQFAKMGSIYYEAFMKKSKPSVGLINIGAEAEKGDQLTKESYALLQEDRSLNFIGNVEGRDIAQGG